MNQFGLIARFREKMSPVATARSGAHGADIYLDGAKLRLVSRAELPDGAMAQIRRHGQAIADWLDNKGAFKERARSSNEAKTR